MRKGRSARFEHPKALLAFNRYKYLAAIFSSYNECERITGIPHAQIQRVCNGERVHTNGIYFRDLKEDVTVESSDLGILTLIEYDRDVLGENRRVHLKGSMDSEIVYESEIKKYKTNPQQNNATG